MRHAKCWFSGTLVCLLFFVFVLDGCGSSKSGKDLLTLTPEERCKTVEGALYDHSLTLSDATQFAVDFLKDGGFLLTVSDGRQYLCLNEEEKRHYEADTLSSLGDITLLSLPAENVYAASTACVDYFIACDALPSVQFSSLKAGDWKVEEAKEAMESGAMVYAGKYSSPDYELLTSRKCDLALENTMIYHSPSVIEQLETLGVPVLVDASSREATPEGRMEWVKLYGLLTGNEAEADQAFSAQKKVFASLKSAQSQTTEKKRPTVAFFSVRSNGTVSVRRTSDSVPYMISLAGGTYVPKTLGEEDDSNRTTQTISMEEFYTAAKSADYFVYNSAIEGELGSVDDLLSLAPVLKDCKAVKDGNVFCTTADLYQHPMELGTFAGDLKTMLGGGDTFTFLFQL